jgi:hypothetical protein
MQALPSIRPASEGGPYKGKIDERFLYVQADRFVPQNRPGRKKRAGANREEKIGLLRSE